jgi:hypothetical protein
LFSSVFAGKKRPERPLINGHPAMGGYKKKNIPKGLKGRKIFILHKIDDSDILLFQGFETTSLPHIPPSLQAGLIIAAPLGASLHHHLQSFG